MDFRHALFTIQLVYFYLYVYCKVDCFWQRFSFSAIHSTSWDLPKLLDLCMRGLNWSPIGYLLQECWHIRHSRRCGCSLSPTDEDCNYLGLISTISHLLVAVTTSSRLSSELFYLMWSQVMEITDCLYLSPIPQWLCMVLRLPGCVSYLGQFLMGF